MKRFASTTALVMSAVLMVVGLCAFQGCTSDPPKNANQWASQIITNYDDAKETAAAYGELPICTQGGTVMICSKAALVVQMKTAKDAAKPVIDDAIKALRDPAITTEDQAAIIAGANHALQMLTDLTNSIAALVHRNKVAVPSS